MRSRSIALVLPTLLAIAACEQPPDVVLTSVIGGAAGMSGDGDGDPDACDQTLVATSAAFYQVQADGCIFDRTDEQLVRLLEEHIFQQPPAMLSPEALSADPACYYLRRLAAMGVVVYRGYRSDVPESAEDITNIDPDARFICPEYCAALAEWLHAHQDGTANCLPGDG
jgi:hypothetical protein